jgi:hypothetical protein
LLGEAGWHRADFAEARTLDDGLTLCRQLGECKIQPNATSERSIQAVNAVSPAAGIVGHDLSAYERDDFIKRQRNALLQRQRNLANFLEVVFDQRLCSIMGGDKIGFPVSLPCFRRFATMKGGEEDHYLHLVAFSTLAQVYLATPVLLGILFGD